MSKPFQLLVTELGHKMDFPLAVSEEEHFVTLDVDESFRLTLFETEDLTHFCLACELTARPVQPEEFGVFLRLNGAALGGDGIFFTLEPESGNLLLCLRRRLDHLQLEVVVDDMQRLLDTADHWKDQPAVARPAGETAAVTPETMHQLA